MDLDVLCRFVFVGWVFNGVCLVFGLVGGIVIVCFVWGGWFVLIGLWCGLECSCRSGSSFAGGGEWCWFGYCSSLVWCGFWVFDLLGVFKLVVLLTHGDVGLDHVYGFLGVGYFNRVVW